MIITYVDKIPKTKSGKSLFITQKLDINSFL